MTQSSGLGLRVHHTAGEAVVDAITCQPAQTTHKETIRMWAGRWYLRHASATGRHLHFSLGNKLMCNSCSFNTTDIAFDLKRKCPSLATNATHLRVDTEHHNVFPQVPGAHHLDNTGPLRFLVQLLLQFW